MLFFKTNRMVSSLVFAKIKIVNLDKMSGEDFCIIDN